MKKRMVIFNSLGQLKEGMRVKFRNSCCKSYRDAVVTDSEYKTRLLLIDNGPPARCTTLKSAKLVCTNGEKFLITERNFHEFTILFPM